MGVFEFDAFAKGTNGIATTLAELTGKGCITIIGGGGKRRRECGEAMK
jgi:phosphoglycerate kinase